jgi:hypothetical protein
MHPPQTLFQIGVIKNLSASPRRFAKVNITTFLFEPAPAIPSTRPLAVLGSRRSATSAARWISGGPGEAWGRAVGIAGCRELGGGRQAGVPDRGVREGGGGPLIRREGVHSRWA